jgi:peptide/nickel transport system permease protein
MDRSQAAAAVNPGRIVAASIIAGTAAAMLFGPALAPHDPQRQYAGYPYAPPMRPHLVDEQGAWRGPFVYPVHLTALLERRYGEDRSRHISLLAGSDEHVFLLGTDALGRDVLSRLIVGARASVGIAILAAAAALLIGAAIGAAAGYAGGVADEIAMRTSEVIVVLPALYIVLAIRAALPLVLEPAQVVAGVAAVLALVGWPIIARGVRAIVRAECTREYVDAARACGASPARLLWRHVLPASSGFLLTQAALLVPAFVIAEATLSFVGFGFAEPTASWGTMLQDAGNIGVFGEYPWLLAPALAVAAVSWAMHSLAGHRPAAEYR